MGFIMNTGVKEKSIQFFKSGRKGVWVVREKARGVIDPIVKLRGTLRDDDLKESSIMDFVPIDNATMKLEIRFFCAWAPDSDHPMPGFVRMKP